MQQCDVLPNKRAHPEHSFMLVMAHKICARSPGSCEKIRNNFSLMLLPNSRFSFVQKQRKLLPSLSATRINSSAHLGIIQLLS